MAIFASPSFPIHMGQLVTPLQTYHLHSGMQHRSVQVTLHQGKSPKRKHSYFYHFQGIKSKRTPRFVVVVSGASLALMRFTDRVLQTFQMHEFQCYITKLISWCWYNERRLQSPVVGVRWKSQETLHKRRQSKREGTARVSTDVMRTRESHKWQGAVLSLFCCHHSCAYAMNYSAVYRHRSSSCWNRAEDHGCRQWKREGTAKQDQSVVVNTGLCSLSSSSTIRKYVFGSLRSMGCDRHASAVVIEIAVATRATWSFCVIKSLRGAMMVQL